MMIITCDATLEPCVPIFLQSLQESPETEKKKQLVTIVKNRLALLTPS